MPQTNKKITALYCRLSQEDMRLGESESIQNQKKILEHYAKEHHFPNIRFFVDDGVSGVDFEREGLQEMLDEVEAGNVAIVITKDLSRLGRNYLKTGELIEIVFPENNVRYIAISDNIDTAREDNEFMPLRNWFNEFYARDTSKKIRAVKAEQARRGERTNGASPYGYIIDPNDRNHLIPDEEAAPVVKKIFELFVEGRSFSGICDWLRENKVCTPSEMYHRRGTPVPYLRPHPDYIYNWDAGLIAVILSRKEYIGTAVTNKGHRVSYKIKKRVTTKDDERWYFENAHEPIVSVELFEAAQKRLEQPHMRIRNNSKKQVVDLYSGLLFCADCGRRLNAIADAYNCGAYRNQARSAQKMVRCTSHYIKRRLLSEVLLLDIKRVLAMVLTDERKFAKDMSQASEVESVANIKAYRRELAKLQIRLEQLKVLLMRTYEDNVFGKLSDEQFSFLSDEYEKEQADIETRAAELKKNIEIPAQQNEKIRKFVAIAKKYAYIADINDLTFESLHALVGKIIVHEADENHNREIEVLYNYIGKIPNEGCPVYVSYTIPKCGNTKAHIYVK